MAYTLIWSPAARFDLLDILSYISEFDADAAIRFGQDVFGDIERLGNFPESGRVLPELLDPTVREIIHRPCRIVYRLDKKERTIEIVRVWHSSRGVPEI